MKSNSDKCHICGHHRPHEHNLSGRWIGVDFDGTLAFSVPNRIDPYTLGVPVPEMVYRVKNWLEEGYTVKLLTARMYPKSSTGGIRDLDLMDKLLRGWTKLHLGTELENTCQKDGWMEVLWDDRAIQVIKETGLPAFSWAGYCCYRRKEE